MSERQEQIAAEALDRAVNGASVRNYPAIYSGFLEKGIAEDQIVPRENVFTYHAWKARGRQVSKGEHGVRIVTYIDLPDKTDSETGEITRGRRRPHCSTVFHVSQTKEL